MSPKMWGFLVFSFIVCGESFGNNKSEVGVVHGSLLRKNKCPVGHFECGGGHKVLLCIPQSANCNGKRECPDGSDEFNCQDIHLKGEWDWAYVKRPDEDAEKLNDTCWYSFEEPTDFTLDKAPQKNEESIHVGGGFFLLSPIYSGGQSGVSDISEEEEEFWLKGCWCAEEKVFCQNVHLQNLHFLPKEIEFLDLSGSRVKEMDFSFTQLHTLVLSGCYVEGIAVGAFQLLSNLRVLYLTNNRLRYLTKGIFSEGNNKIRQLSLDYNQISVLQEGSFSGLSSLVELNLRHNLLTGRESDAFVPLTFLKILHLSDNRIESVRKSFLRGLNNLETLSLHNNLISYIETSSFQDLLNLKELYLNRNKLRILESHVFCKLENLLILNVGGNEISILENDAFACLSSLTSLNVGKNLFGEVTQASRIFSNLTQLNYIYFDHFWMCSWAPHVRSCEPKGDGISSQSNLLDSVILRICVWIMGILSIVGNLFVIFCRIIIREPNRVHSFYIKNLAGADLLMGLYLLNIAYHDVSYRGAFLAHQYAWRHSLTCQASGLLSTWSSEASVLILTLITLDRYLSIVKPFAEKTLSSLNVGLGICIFLWLLSFLLSVLPLSSLFPKYFEYFYASNGLCLPLHIHNPYESGWEYSFLLFVLLNSLAFIFMCFAYMKMLQVIRKSTLMIRSTQQKQDSILAKRFALVVFTDFLCWAPIVAAKIVGMSGVAIPSPIYAWLAVFALPVNSAINPIIYTLTTKLFKQQLSKMTLNIQSRFWRRNAPDESTVSLSIFRYRTPRTANTSVQSMRQNSTMQMKVLVPNTSGEGNKVIVHHATASFATVEESDMEQ